MVSPFTGFREWDIFNNKDSITLYLIPKVVTLGTGCRKAKTYSEINSFIREALNNAGIFIRSVEGIERKETCSSKTGRQWNYSCSRN